MKTRLQRIIGLVVLALLWLTSFCVPAAGQVAISAMTQTNQVRTNDFFPEISAGASGSTYTNFKARADAIWNLPNTNNNLAASNFWLNSHNRALNGAWVYNDGIWTSPDDPNFSHFLNVAHGGAGDGVEEQWTFNQLYFGPIDGGHVQHGLGSHSNEFWFMQHATTPQANATPTNFTGHSHFWGWVYTYAGTNGTGLGGYWWEHASNYDNGTGGSQLITFAPNADKTQNVGSFSSFGPPELTEDANGFLLPQNNFIQPFIALTNAGTNYFFNWTNAHTVEIDLTNDLNLVETNLNFAVNSNLNNFALEKDLFIYPTGTNRNFNVPINWRKMWQFTNASTTVIPNSNFFHVHVWETLGLGTNTYYNVETGPAFDPDAQNFINAAGIGNPTTQAALNNLVLAMKADGTWALMDCIYPFVGGTSSSESFNLKNPSTFQITWHGTVTFNANGITGDGSTGYGDSLYKPSTVGGNFTLNSASMSVYLKTGALASGDLGSGFGSTGAQRFGIQNTTSANTWSFAGLNNATTGNGQVIASPTTGFLCATRTSSITSTMYVNAQSTADATASSALCNSDIGILCREDTGPTQDHFSAANLAFLSWGAGLDATHEGNLNTDVLAFETALSRQ